MAAIRGDRNRTWAPSTTGTITEDLRNFGLVQISPKFERSPKTSQTLHRRVKEIQQGSCLNIYLPLVQNCQNLRRIPLPRVPTWSVCGLDPVHHLRTRALFFLTAVIYDLDKCVLRYFNSFTCKEEREKFTPKKCGKSTLTADLSFNAPLILIAPKLVFNLLLLMLFLNQKL